MTTSFSRRRWFAAAALAGTLLAAPLHAADPEQLRIGFQKSAVNLLVLKQQGTLEKRFPKTAVSWIEFPAGPQLLEALAVGSIDFGLTGDTPPVFAQAAGKDLVYVGAEPPKPDSSAILVPATSNIQSLVDLKGKRIAFQKGSSAHNLLVRALEKAGLTWNDVTPVYLAPAEARAAFERGSIDAWAIWDPYYAAAEYAVRPRVLTTGRTLSANNSFYLASKDIAARSPEVISALLTELSNADAWIQGHKREAAQRLSDYSGLPFDVSYRFVARRPTAPTTPLRPETVADQQRVADSFFRLGLIPKAVRVSDIVWQPNANERLARNK
jgi:sulfonate transport system substrate-binding protein